MNTKPKIKLKRPAARRLLGCNDDRRKLFGNENPELAKKRLMKLATAIKKVTRQLDVDEMGQE